MKGSTLINYRNNRVNISVLFCISKVVPFNLDLNNNAFRCIFGD